jgi:hypothetical protein
MTTIKTVASAAEEKDAITRVKLLEVFNDTLPIAKKLVDLAIANEEPHSFAAHECYTAFETAAQELAEKEMLPKVGGNSPQELGDPDISKRLTSAMVSVYGFTAQNTHPDFNRQSKKAFTAMQPISSALHRIAIIS